jgi:hypothetical protein
MNESEIQRILERRSFGRGGRLTHWCIYGVLLPLVPVGFAWLSLAFDSTDIPDLMPIIRHGDLLLLCVAISTTALGELTLLTNRGDVPEILCKGTCSICAVSACLIFARITTKPATNEGPLWWVTVFICLATFVSAAAGILLVHGDE